MANPILAIVGVGQTGLAQGQAKLFAQHGFDIALISRDQTALKTATDELAALNIKTTILTADLTKLDTITAAFDQIKSLGQLRAVIFNATYRPGIAPSKMTADLVQTGLTIGAVAPVAIVQAALPQLTATTEPTALLFTNSIAGAKPSTNAALQAMEKAAMRNYVITLNEDLTKKQSTVYAGMVTINTYIRHGKKENQDPDNIARAYYKLFEARSPVELPYHDLISE
ncbi:SDR family oxidoreductase [Furfurilactobacillus curtus]|uniref:Short-chain dehydrogenase n=1 Tax=Furfurilactobacillus curtus TaxID=1746200 RepID=A0ABQ5JMA0_9LACO